MKIYSVSDLMRLAYIKISAFAEAIQARCAQNPKQQRIMLASAGLTFTGLFASSAAHAEGIADMFTTGGQQADTIKDALGKIFSAAGFAGAGYGGYNWWRKGKEGEQSQIKGSQIFVPILGGAALGAIGYVMIKAGESVGISASQQGVIPN